MRGALTRSRLLGIGSVLLVGCTPRLGADEGGLDGLDSSANETQSGGDADAGSGGTSADDAASAEDDGPDTFGDDCGSWLPCEEDLPPPLEMCDFWAQDCPAGEKCTPISSYPGNPSWDAHVCAPFGADSVGDPCTVADGPAGADSCNAVSKCYDIDADTGLGTCIPFCVGSEFAPVCPPEAGPGAECQGSFNLCSLWCNPLLPGDCPASDICVPKFEGSGLGGFICFPPDAEGLGGEACECANCCASQHMCVAAADYGPDCAFDLCCTEYCDVEDSSFVCDGTDQVCVALFDPSTPELGNVGRCVVP